MRNKTLPRSKPALASAPAGAATASPSIWRPLVIQAGMLFGLALVLRLAHFWAMRGTAFYDVFICDAWSYDNWARKIAAGDWLGDELFYQTPLYPYTIAVLYTVFGLTGWAIRIFQALCGALACVALARSGASFFSERVGWVAGLLLAFYPPAIFFDGLVQKASLDLLLMTLLLWATGAAQSRPRGWLVALSGAILAALTLNRENALVLIPVLLAWAAWLGWSQSPVAAVRNAVLVCVGMAALLLPVGFRNWYVGDAFLLTTSQFGANFWMGNHLGASGRAEPLLEGRGDPRTEREDAKRLAEQALGRELTMPEVSRYWLDRSLADMKADPAWWIGLLGWKWFLNWNACELADAESMHVHADFSWLLAGLIPVLHFGVLCPLAAAGLWFTRHDWRRLWILYGLALVFAAAVTIFYVFARYRYPLVPIVALFAGAGAIGGWDLYRQRAVPAWRELAIGGALALVAAVFCNWPVPAWYRDDEVSYFSVGTALLDANRPREAIEPLLTAVRIKPDFAAAYNNLGQAHLNLDEPQAAREALERAVSADPKFSAAWLGLGNTLEKLGDPSGALRCYRRAIEVDSTFSFAYRAAGRVQLQLGHAEAAVDDLARVVQLNPKNAAVRADLAGALLVAGRLGDALAELRAAVQLNPQTPVANELAWILATAPDEQLRDGAEAVRLAEALCRAGNPQRPEHLDTLAAAYAEAGRFEEAARTAATAVELLGAAGDAQHLAAFRARLELYRAKQPYRDPALKPRGGH